MVLDVRSDTVVDTIVVGDNPSSLALAEGNTLWVASGGAIAYNEDFTAIDEVASTPGFIAQLRDGAVWQRWDVDKINAGPEGIVSNPTGTRLYYHYDSRVYGMSGDASSLPSTPIINERAYGLAVDPVSEEILTGTLPNFSDDGTFSRFASDGTLIQRYTVGIAPNGFAF